MDGGGGAACQLPPPHSQPGSWVTQPGCWVGAQPSSWVLSLAPGWLSLATGYPSWLLRAGAAMRPSKQPCGCRAPGTKAFPSSNTLII